MNVAAVIPALDEEAGIGAVVAETRAAGVDLVVVADNGSTDRTAAVAEAAGGVVVSEPKRGYGRACRAGSEAALHAGADVLVYLDGDHSSRPSQLDRLLDPVRADRADLVLGSRTRGEISAGAMPPHQRFGNWLSAGLMRRLYDVEVTDLAPYRAIRADVYRHLGMGEMTFGWPTEMMVKCARRGDRIVEVPVSWDVRRGGRSKVSGTVKGSVLAAWHIIGVTLRHARWSPER